MISDQNIKTLQVTLPIVFGNSTRLVTMLITEKDIIDLEFRKAGENKTYRVLGEIIKIGVDPENADKKYLTILSYEYENDTNVFKVFLSEIKRVVNINHTGDPYAFGPIYSPDESVILIRDNNGFEYSKDGETWKPVSGGEGSSTVVDSFYDKCVEQGWNGTEEDLAAAIVELCNNKDKIPTVEKVD